MADQPPPFLPPAFPGQATAAGIDRRVVAIGLAAVLLLCVATLTLLSRLADQPLPGAIMVPRPGTADLPPPAAADETTRAQARAAAGCRLLVDGVPFEDRTHLDPNTAPPPAALYPEHRPAHSGRHYPRPLALPSVVPPVPIDERAVVHNMEHGTVVVWFDADRVDEDTLAVMQDWMRERRDLGFSSDAAGGIFVSPTDVIDSGSAIALRAWGVAMDCDRFDLTVADAFLSDHWGSHGESPEAHLSPFPEGALPRGTTV